MDMFGIKRGRCMEGDGHACLRFQQRYGLYKTEGLGGLAMAKCARCSIDNIYHEDLGRWEEGMPQLVTEEGEMFKWVQLVEDGKVVVKKIQME